MLLSLNHLSPAPDPAPPKLIVLRDPIQIFLIIVLSGLSSFQGDTYWVQKLNIVLWKPLF